LESETEGRNKKRWARRIILALLVLGVAYMVLLLFLSRFLDPEELAGRLEPRLEAAVGREVDIGSAQVSFFPLGMRLTNLVVVDPTGLAPALARVSAVEFQVALIPLLRKEVRVRKLLVETPEVFLHVGLDGGTNFGDFSTSAGEPSEGGSTQQAPPSLPFELALESVHVTGGWLRYSDAQEVAEATVQGIEVRASVRGTETGSWTIRGDSRAEMSFTTTRERSGLTGLPITLSLDISSEPGFEEIQIRSGRVGVESATLDVSGSLRDLKSPVRHLALTLTGRDISLERLSAALPDSLRDSGPELRGGLDADLRVEGPLGPDSIPTLSGTARMTNVGVRAPDGTTVVRALTADLALSPEGILQVDALGEMLDGPFSVGGQGEIGGALPVDLRMDLYPDLEMASSLAPLPEGMSVEGRVKVDGRLTGPLRTPRELRFWGEASPADVRVRTAYLGVPAELREGRFAFQGNRVSFPNLRLSLGRDSLTVSGEATNLTTFGLPGRSVGVQASVRGPRLDLVAMRASPPPNPDLTYGKVAFARLGNRQAAGLPVPEAAEALGLRRPDSLPLAGEVAFALDTVVDARGRMHDVRGTATFGPEFLRVSQAAFRRYGGQLQASANISLGPSGPEPFSFQVSVTDLNAGEFLEATSPLGTFVRGRLSLTMELAGDLDSLLLPERSSLVGSGNFELTDGGLNPNRVTESLANFLGMEEFRNPEIRDWATGFIMEGGMIRLAEATLAQAPGDPRVGGSVGFGGELDLLSAFTLPTERLGSFARENLGIAGEIAGRVANRPEVVQAIVRIGGSIVSPNLTADPGATAQAITSAVQEEVTNEAQTRVREQRERLQERATGFIRGLLQPRGATAGDTASADSLAADTLPGDSVGADTLPPEPNRPDTVLPDSLRPDTVPPDTLRPDTVAPDTLKPDTIAPDTLKPETIPTGALGPIPSRRMGGPPKTPVSAPIRPEPHQPREALVRLNLIPDGSTNIRVADFPRLIG